MPQIRSYHLGRERTEQAMAVKATSAVARISHAKLAALHRAIATSAITDAGNAPALRVAVSVPF